jgi:uncharacterized protein YwqG
MATAAGMLLSLTVMSIVACSPKPAVPQRLPATEPVVATVRYGELPPEMAKFSTEIARSQLAYIDIIADKNVDVAPWNSKLGGLPYLPQGQAYPTGPDGASLALLAQLNFSEMPVLEGYPAQGILQFFIAGGNVKAHIYGMAQYDAKPYNEQDFFAALSKQTWFKLIYHPQVVQDRATLQSPPVLSREMMLPLTGTTRLRFQAGTEPVSMFDYRFQRFFGKPADKFFAQFGAQEDAAAVNYQAFSRKANLAKMGGYSSPVQNDPRMIRPAEDWVVLLELQEGREDGSFDLMWGDGGMGAFYIRADDLKRRDFSRVVYYWDNH